MWAESEVVLMLYHYELLANNGKLLETMIFLGFVLTASIIFALLQAIVERSGERLIQFYKSFTVSCIGLGFIAVFLIWNPLVLLMLFISFVIVGSILLITEG